MYKESKDLELKEKITDSFLKTVSAYANYGTGKIVFGVNDDGVIVGLEDIKKTRLDIENRINSNIDPIPEYYFDEDEKEKVLTLIVNEGNDKPYFYKSKTYMRRDTSTIEVDKVSLKKLIIEQDNISFDSLKNNSQDLEFTILEKALKDKMNIVLFTLDTLKTLELYSDKEGFNKAAGLLSDINDFYGIDIVRFGENINVFLDRVILNKMSIIEQYNKAVEKFVQYYIYEEIEGAYRVKKEKIPESAFREVVANALINRDWNNSSNINISFYDDRIEIISHGGLPNEISKQDYLEKEISIPKNPIIANVFFRLGYIERFGTGVQRIKLFYKNNKNKPVFNVSETTIKITLPLLESATQILSDDTTQTTQTLEENTTQTTQTLEENTTQTTQTFKDDNINNLQEKIISIIKRDNKITLNQVANQVGITRDGVKYYITKLQKQGKIRHEGTDNKGYWVVVDV